ncbi:DUF1990 domain-containing protein [Streptomyces sp. SCA3-4]|uniref:DUF1990 family protein n=1 Tax=Streptomyces sichuanensis TaxID=2871810 RepID=UPI001CE29E67|nr:DUF1990 domain-containing protein [Streptomyces sichuanensis]MCA6091619.1 DUF1990 domain-containing protein [Streptomyces sichuanensis]
MTDRLTYPEAGATAAGRLPGGYHHLRVTTRVGHGGADFRAAADAVLTWRMHRAMTGVRIPGGTPDPAPGVRVTPAIGFGPLSVSGPCAVVWAVREERRAGFGYGTLPGHPERGEEAFVVTMDAEGGVLLTVLAFSRPARWFTRLAGPAVPLFQRYYARSCGRALRTLVQGVRAGRDERKR